MIKFLNDRDRDKVNFSTTGHTHKNYEELKKIKELQGKITYDGKNIRMVDDGRVISKIVEEDGYINIYLDGYNEEIILPSDVISIPTTLQDKNSHTHANKAVLDDLTVSEGVNGNRLVYDSILMRTIDDGAVIESVTQDDATGNITIAYKQLPLKVVPADTITIEGNKALWAAINEIRGGIDEIEAIIDDSGVLE